MAAPQSTVMVSGRDLSSDTHPLVPPLLVTVAVPPVTWATFEPDVVQPDTWSTIVVVSAAEPPSVSAGEKSADPLTVRQAMAPVATPPAGTPLPPQAAAVAATSPSAHS